jgi:AcrR family transcriptional regulator
MNMRSPTEKERDAGKRPYRMSARAAAAAATRERLLAAAWEQFATRPYDDVLLQEVAAAAGVTAQTLHLRFGSKEELFSAAFTWWGVREIATREEVPVGNVPAAIANLFDHYESQGLAVLRMLSQEERIPAVAEMTEAGRIYHRAWVERTLGPLLRGSRGAGRKRRLAALVVATDVFTWKLLRRDMDLGRGEAESVVAEMVGAAETTKGARDEL